MSGRNVDLGSSAGIQTIGNFLDPAALNGGARITIETGLGSQLAQPDYPAFTAQFVDPTTASASQYAEPLQLFDANGNAIGAGDQAYAYLESLSPAARDILLNRVFFGLGAILAANIPAPPAAAATRSGSALTRLIQLAR